MFRGLEKFNKTTRSEGAESSEQAVASGLLDGPSGEKRGSATSSGVLGRVRDRSVPMSHSGTSYNTSAESEKQYALRLEDANKLNRSLFQDRIVTDVQDEIETTDQMDKKLLSEMVAYESDAQIFRRNPHYLNPLQFWSDKRSTYPMLYKLALKMLAVPATSILSEQVFSGAGQIATKGRIQLSAKTLEMLVYLQRSMTKQDVMGLTPNDFQEERRTVLAQRRDKARVKAYQEAIDLLNMCQPEAFQYANEAQAAVVDGTDDQMIFETETTFEEQEVVPDNVQFFDVDEGLGEVFEMAEVEDVQQDIEEQLNQYKSMNPSRWARLSERERQMYLFDGLD